MAKKSSQPAPPADKSVDRDAARHDAIEFLLKKTPTAFRPEDEPLQLEGISTGSIAVDYIIGNNGFPRSKVCEIFGLPSCVAADTQLLYAVGTDQRFQNTKGGTIRRLYERFHRLAPTGDGRGKYPRPQTASAEFFLPCANEEDKLFRNRIRDVVTTGTKACYTVETAQGLQVSVSEEHEFYTGERFVRLADLQVGDHVMVSQNGRPSKRDEGYRAYLFVKHHPVAGLKPVVDRKTGKTYVYHRLARARAVAEARLNHLSLADYVERLDAGQLTGLQFLSREDHVHHVDEDFQNDHPDNLLVIKAALHGQLHAMDRFHGLSWFATADRVVRIKPCGRQATFDVRMEAPFNNYVANRFVVHNSGKSTLAATACAKAQKQGLYPVYVDVERGLDAVYATKIGFNVAAARRGENGLYVTPESFEDMLIIVSELAKDGLADLIFVDSVPSLVTRASLEGDITALGQIGESARMFSASLPKLTKIIDKPGHRTCLVFVNQMRARISTGWQPHGAPTGPKAMGGYALEHYSSLRLELRQINKNAKVVERPSITNPKDTVKTPVASLHTALAFKNKVSTPYRQINFYIRYNPETDEWGIDNLQTIIEIGLTKKVIEAKGGGNYLYNGSESMQVRGEDLMYQWLAARPAVIAEIRDKLGV